MDRRMELVMKDLGNLRPVKRGWTRLMVNFNSLQ